MAARMNFVIVSTTLLLILSTLAVSAIGASRLCCRLQGFSRHQRAPKTHFNPSKVQFAELSPSALPSRPT
jgi:hypothetical protein